MTKDFCSGDMPLISVITSCFNAEKMLSRTIESVIRQSAVLSGRVRLQYIIQDASSSDGTRQLVESYNHPDIEFFSEPDSGLYDGLARALRRATGDVVCYINAGDYYSESAFSVVADCFDIDGVDWINGARVLYNERDQIVSMRDPVPFCSELIFSGVYGPVLPYIQQESTFWRRRLLQEIDWHEFSSYKLAGDYYLWSCFSRSSRLYSVRSFLGGFKIHENQLSLDKKSYFLEIRKAAGRGKSLVDWLRIVRELIKYMFASELRDKVFSDGIICYDFECGRWKLAGKKD